MIASLIFRRSSLLGLLFAGLSFIVILLPSYFGGTDTLVNPLWLILSIFIVVLGELCLSPVGLSATTKLAPAAFSAQTMSLWFLSNAAAQALNAQLVKFYSPETEMMYFGDYRWNSDFAKYPLICIITGYPAVYERCTLIQLKSNKQSREFTGLLVFIFIL